MEGKGWRSPLGPLRGFAADNGPCCGEMGSWRAARCRRPSRAAAARWSPLPHLPLPSCQPCTAPHPGVTKWGKCLPRARGGGSPPKTPVQILQGGVQPCPPNQLPAVSLPCLPHWVQGKQGQPWGSGAAGVWEGHISEGLRPSLQHCSCPEHLQGAPAVRPFPILTQSPISNHNACWIECGPCCGIPGSQHHCRSHAGKGAVQGRQPGTAPPLSPPATHCQLKVTAPPGPLLPSHPSCRNRILFPMKRSGLK